MKPTNCEVTELPEKNLIFVKGLLALGDETEASKPSWLGGMAVWSTESLQPGAGSSQGQLSPGGAGSVLCWVSEREERGRPDRESSPIHRAASGLNMLAF